jgi:hypothetical protein
LRRITIAIIFTLIFIVSCDSGNNEENYCYILTSSNPCFDSNTGGSTTIVTDQTVEEVILDQESMPGFQMSLDITNIIKKLAFINPFDERPDCPYEQSELVIKTENDWNRFRASCFFSFFDLPDVDFENDMVLVSIQAFAEFGTAIEAVLEFDDSLSVVIQDDVSQIATPAPAFPINIVSVPRVDSPVNFIRVENDITPL